MQILVTLTLSGNDQWGLIDLQGTLETTEGISSNMHIGDLHLTSTGKAHLVVGHHLLTGEIVTLDTPLAVMQRERRFQEAGPTEYVVAAIIKTKITFKTRPKPLVKQEAM